MDREESTQPEENARAEGASSDSTLLLVRFSGDLTTKADATRRRMTSRLIENLRAAIRLSGRSGRVRRQRNRLYIELDPIDADASGRLPDDDAMADRLARVFGVQTLSLAHARPWSQLSDVVRDGERFGRETVRGKRFAVRARRVGERHEVPIRMGEIERTLGAVLDQVADRVDLKHPEATVYIELDAERAYYFVSKVRGEGGLPLGTEGRAVSLLSGGFDSPVASWRLLRRGIALDYAFCNLGGRQHELETLAIAKRLSDRWQAGTRPRFHTFDFDPVSREIQTRVAKRYWQIVLKRMMLRAAEAVAESWGAGAVVTGEAIGQVSSQTLQNLAVISEGARWPILRPVVGNNKDEIIEEARRVGTHDLSAKVGEYCAIVPRNPATHARLEDVLAEEAKLDPAVLAEAIEARTALNLPDLDLAAFEAEDLLVRSIAPEDIVIDLRPKPAYTQWHYPGALFLDFPNALRAYSSLAPGQRYVLYCEFGLKSAHLADLMRKAGLSARHVSGGMREVRRLAEAAS